MTDNSSAPVQARRVRSLSAAMIVAGVFAIGAVALLWYLFDVILLVFGAVLIAVLLRAPADWLVRHTRLSSPWALAVVVVVIAALLVGAGWLLGASVREQWQAISQQLPQMIERVRAWLTDLGWAVGGVDTKQMLEGEQSAFLGRGLRVVTRTFGALANVVLVLFMAVLFAAQPRLYVRGTLRLVPKHKRKRMAEVMHRVGDTLRRWMVGQLSLMVFVGVTSTVGLSLLGVQAALALGLLAGLLTFIPFIGPVIAAVIAVLVSLSDGALTAAWVALLYVGIQTVEGLLEPLVQQKAVYLPPVLLLIAQLALGVLVGMVGIVLATPLAAAMMVIVQMLYVEDVLQDSMESAS